MSETPTDTTTDASTDTERDRERRGVDTVDTDTMKWISGIVSLIGLWMAASPFLYEVTETALWNNVVVGLAIFLIAGYNYYRMANDHLASTGSAALVALLGLWMVLSPFVLETGSEALMWSNIVSGLVVAVLAAYNAYANREADTARTRTAA